MTLWSSETQSSGTARPLAEGKVHIHGLPGARVLDVSAQIPAILKEDESVAAVVIHAGANDTKLRQTKTLKRDFRSLIETVRSLR